MKYPWGMTGNRVYAQQGPADAMQMPKPPTPGAMPSAAAMSAEFHNSATTGPSNLASMISRRRAKGKSKGKGMPFGAGG